MIVPTGKQLMPDLASSMIDEALRSAYPFGYAVALRKHLRATAPKPGDPCHLYGSKCVSDCLYATPGGCMFYLQTKER